MWTYVITWTLASIALAPLVGKLLARQGHTTRQAALVRASARPLIPMQRGTEATVPGWRIPRQVTDLTDDARRPWH